MPKQAPHSKNRKPINNYNPHNILELNKFHQVKREGRQKVGKQLHKKKRDLERIIQHRKDQGLPIEKKKYEELEAVNEQLEDRKKGYEKEKRKEFFIDTKYKQIMNIEKRKIAKQMRDIKDSPQFDHSQYQSLLLKLNYIKHYPKNLKYVSLFPSGGLSDKAKQFQDKIMNDIKQDQEKKKQKMNQFQNETAPKEKKKTEKKKDDFFLLQQEQEQGQGQGQEEQEGIEEQSDS